MKIRSQSLNRFIGVVAAAVIRALFSTIRYKVCAAMPSMDPIHPHHDGPHIYAFWHESILAMAGFGIRGDTRIAVMISQHQDGEYIAQTVRQLGMEVVRGSSTRGGRSALKGMIQAADDHNLAITPDGPRGPRRRFQSGAVYLAARTGLRIVPIGFGFTNAWRAKSWDQFAIPMPYSVVTAVGGTPITVPGDVTEADLETWRCHVESSLCKCSEAAELWALGGTAPKIERRAA